MFLSKFMTNLDLENRFDEDILVSLIDSSNSKNIPSFLRAGRNLRDGNVDDNIPKKVRLIEEYLNIDIEEIYLKFGGFDRQTIGFVYNHIYDSLLNRNGFNEKD